MKFNYIFYSLFFFFLSFFHIFYNLYFIYILYNQYYLLKNIKEIERFINTKLYNN